MAIQHNYLNTDEYKPQSSEITQAELVPNLADGTLWTENTSGKIIELSGHRYIQGSTVSTTPTDIALFSSARYDAAEIIVVAIDTVAGDTQISKLLLTHDGTTAVSTQYGDVYTSASPLTTLNVNLTTGTINLNVTSASANSTSYRIKMHTI